MFIIKMLLLIIDFFCWGFFLDMVKRRPVDESSFKYELNLALAIMLPIIIFAL